MKFKLILLLAVFTGILLPQCSGEKGNEVKERIEAAIDSLKSEMDSLSRALDTLNAETNPMVAEQTVQEVRRATDSIFLVRSEWIEKEWQKEEWTVKERGAISSAWKDLVEYRLKLQKMLAEQLYQVKEKHTRVRERHLQESEKLVEEQKKQGFGPLKQLWEETQVMNAEARLHLELLKKDLELEKDSLIREAERAKDSLFNKFN